MKLLITTHGSFCEGIIESYNMIAGSSENISYIKLDDSGIGTYKEKLDKWMDINLKEDILVLCDLKGGTPYNEVFQYHLKYPERIKVVAGLNLAMLIEVGTSIDFNDNIEELTSIAIDTGIAGVSIAEIEDDFDENLEF